MAVMGAEEEQGAQPLTWALHLGCLSSLSSGPGESQLDR
jgi:hypothetical protein